MIIRGRGPRKFIIFSWGAHHFLITRVYFRTEVISFLEYSLAGATKTYLFPCGDPITFSITRGWRPRKSVYFRVGTPSFLDYSQAGAAKIDDFRSGRPFLDYSCLFSGGSLLISGIFAGLGSENILISARRSHHFLDYSRVEGSKKVFIFKQVPIIS